MIAAVGDDPYNIVYVVHLFSVILGVGVAFIAPILTVRARRESGVAMQNVIEDVASKIMFPALLVAGMAGGALVGMSADFYDFQQPWLSVGGAIWMLVLVLTLAVYPPSYLRVINVSTDRKRMLGGILHLSLAVMLVLMTWKFGDAPGVS